MLTDPPDGPPVSVERLVDGGIDGAILTTTWLDASLPRELAERGLPTVLFNRVVDDDVADSVESDNAQGAGLVAEELVALGHRVVGAVFGPLGASTGRDRERGLRDALAAAGVPLEEERIRRGAFSHELGHAGFEELMALPHPPTAVFCANDVLAIGALNAAAGLGIAVPGDVTVFGFDDIEMAGWEVYRLSTVRQDLGAMADVAVRMLGERIADRSLPTRRERVPTTLVPRTSHARPRRRRAARARGG
jgi:LacI family transcriptional regulator